MRKLPWAAVAMLAGTVGMMNVFAGCGSEVDGDIPPPNADGGDEGSSSDGDDQDGSAANDGAGQDGNISDGGNPDALTCKNNGASCATDTDCCSASCISLAGGGKVCGAPAECKATGTACTTASECCGLSCKGGSCQKCVADSPTPGNCTSDADCCSQNCSNGKCAPVPTGGGGSTTCRTSGNPCATGSDCCSKTCIGGVCGSVSFCTQNDDICTNDFECCGGACVKAQGATAGRCGTADGPNGGCGPAGTVCAGTDTVCDVKCCSKACAPFGASGVKVCQPPSGCRPQYELCQESGDCCGGPGQPENVTSHPNSVVCAPDPRSAPFGRCEKHKQCDPPGAVCKIDKEACGVENSCCRPEGTPSDFCNSNPNNCCGRDALGIPRCLVKAVNCTGADGGAPPKPGDLCATSADCCGKPCVNNKCEGSCVPKGGTCTTSGDCCTGLPCTIPVGATKGICDGAILTDGGVAPPPDGGTGTKDGGTGGNDAGTGTCALYGQTCNADRDCCGGVPCTSGRCRYP